MPDSRRQFLAKTSLGLLAAAVSRNAEAQEPSQLPPGAPSAFGTGPAVGPEVSPDTFAEAEKLARVELRPAERTQAAASWRVNMAALMERRTGPRNVSLSPPLAPFSRYDSVLPGQHPAAERDRFVRPNSDPGPLPSNDADIAFAPVTKLSRWIEHRELTSERLTHTYLNRSEQFDPRLRSVITLTRDLALAQAKKADAEIAAGKYRGPLHGIPWAAKDLLVSPSMRCGITGLRPTYGRVPRTGAMTLCWSLDKLGPMTRSVEDAMLVLQAITGPDAGDVSSVPSHLDFDSGASIKGLRVGYFPNWMKQPPATDVDRAALETIEKLGMRAVEVFLPDWPYGSLNVNLFAEGAASFEELTLSHGVDQLKMQTHDSWPNLFRQARFLSAVDFVQTDRFRRKVCQEMARLFSDVDLLLVPSLRDEMLTISNNTGHPSLTLRAGFVEVSQVRSDWAPDPQHPLPKFVAPRRVPHGITLIGRLFDEGTLCRAGMALESVFGVASDRPAGFSARRSERASLRPPDGV